MFVTRIVRAMTLAGASRPVAAAALLVAATVAGGQQPAPTSPLLKPLPATPRTLAPAQQTAPAPSSAKQPLEPAWPLRFELLAGERTGTGFAVTRTGPIRVTLQSGGAALVLSLTRPDGRVLERRGSGALQIDDAATDADVQRGVLWRVGVRAAQETPVKAPTRVTRPLPAAVIASGSLSVQHPGADPQRAQAALATAAASRRSTRPAAASLDAAKLRREEQLAHDQQVAQRQSAALQQLGASVPAAALQQMQQRIGLRAQGQSLQQAQASVPVKLVAGPAQQQVVDRRLVRAPGGGATASVGSASTGNVAPVGSGNAPATTMPAPQLTGNSIGEGDPGTPVSLTGANFGETPGEVHFIVANGRDIAAPVTYWSGAQIVTEVPYSEGIPVYDGHVYVKRGDGTRTALLPFRFIPVYDVGVIGLPLRENTKNASTYDTTPAVKLEHGMIGHGDMSNILDLIFGGRGEVHFYQTTRLRNGWLVDSAMITTPWGSPGPYIYNSAGASIADLRANTDSPYVKVRWWRDAGSSVHYVLRITVKRPRKLPCSSDPCAVL